MNALPVSFFLVTRPCHTPLATSAWKCCTGPEFLVRLFIRVTSCGCMTVTVYLSSWPGVRVPAIRLRCAGKFTRRPATISQRSQHMSIQNLPLRQIMASFAYLAYCGEQITTPDPESQILDLINTAMP